MPEPPRRKRFQVHLSTAIVLMFVAGMLIWGNVARSLEDGYGDMGLFWSHYTYGWPIVSLSETEVFSETRGTIKQNWTSYSPNYLHISIDLIIALVILFVVWFGCECLIRRRAARKDA